MLMVCISFVLLLFFLFQINCIHMYIVCLQVPKSCVDLAIKSWPHLLGCSVGKLKVMVKQFAELGISNKKLVQVIAKSPQLLLLKPHEFQLVCHFITKDVIVYCNYRHCQCSCSLGLALFLVSVLGQDLGLGLLNLLSLVFYVSWSCFILGHCCSFCSCSSCFGLGFFLVKF